MDTILVPRLTWITAKGERNHEMVEILSEDRGKSFTGVDIPAYPNALVHIDAFEPFQELYKQLYAGKKCKILHIRYEIVKEDET